jgi:hypothetical protein
MPVYSRVKKLLTTAEKPLPILYIKHLGYEGKEAIHIIHIFFIYQILMRSSSLTAPLFWTPPEEPTLSVVDSS